MSTVEITGINNCDDATRRYFDANASTMSTLATQAQADGNLFGDSSLTCKTQATSEAEKLEEKQEEIEAEIAAYLEQEQAKLDAEIERAKIKARAEYDKERDGDDEEAFVQSEIAKDQRLQRTIGIPEKMQAELDSNKALLKLARDKESAQVENQVLLNQMREACFEKASEINKSIQIDISA